MPAFTTVLIIAATGVAIYNLFSGKKADDQRSSSSASPPRSTGATPQPYPSSPHDSYSRGQTNTRVPATSYQSPSRTPTHVGDSHWFSSASTRAQPSYPQPPSSTRDYSQHTHRSVPVAPYAGESRETPRTSGRTHAPLRPQLSSSRVGQTGVSTTTTAGYDNGVHRTGLASHYAGRSGQTPSSSTRAQASYPRVPSPDVTRTYVFGSYLEDSPPTRSRTLSSSSGSDYLGPTSSPRRVPRPPSPVPDAQYGVGFESAATTGGMKATAEPLRERARCSKREMHKAQGLAKSARKRGDHEAEQSHKQDAIAYESEMKSLDKRAAKIFFGENNKVRGHHSPCQRHAQPRSCQALPKGTVDLHGLYVLEALEYAKKELQSAIYRDDDKICFITGASFSDHCVVPFDAICTGCR